MQKKKNSNLNVAKVKKNDEFYTELSDIENELKHYKQQLKGKVIYCNCDDPSFSNFYQFFKNNFTHLKLQKLITTHYSKDISKDPAYKLECTLDATGTLLENKIFLSGDGDFRSPECISLLIESDIVCTNPPFSLFREYIQQMLDYKKQFLVIGPENAATTLDIFTHFINQKIWMGHNNVKSFLLPNKTVQKMGNVCWFTNLKNPKRNQHIILWKNYKPKDYPKYDNYDAINVNSIASIPVDYLGVMGVPCPSFFKHYSPTQFEIVGNEKTLGISKGRGYVNGQKMYSRVFIKRKP